MTHLTKPNARDPNGLVHEIEFGPTYHAANPVHVTKHGFTWCMAIFTWADGPRIHPVSDGAEGRYEKTDEHATCLECIGTPHVE